MSETVTPEIMITPRSVQLLEAMAHGFSNWQIGRIYSISENTVKSGLGQVFDDLGIVAQDSSGYRLDRRNIALTMLHYSGLFDPERDLQQPGEVFRPSMVDIGESSIGIQKKWHATQSPSTLKVPGRESEAPQPVDVDTPFRREVLKGVLLGFRFEDLADILETTEYEVKQLVVRNVRESLGLVNRHQLGCFVLARGLVNLGEATPPVQGLQLWITKTRQNFHENPGPTDLTSPQ